MFFAVPVRNSTQTGRRPFGSPLSTSWTVTSAIHITGLAVQRRRAGSQRAGRNGHRRLRCVVVVGTRIPETAGFAMRHVSERHLAYAGSDRLTLWRSQRLGPHGQKGRSSRQVFNCLPATRHKST